MNKKLISGFVVLFFLFLITSAYSISPSEIRDILNKPVASVDDALYMLSSLDTPSIEHSSMIVPDNSRIKAMKPEEDLDIGKFGVLSIEMKKLNGGFLYSITGFSKWAADSLVYQNIIRPDFSFNRIISGKELIEFVTALRDVSK